MLPFTEDSHIPLVRKINLINNNSIDVLISFMENNDALRENKKNKK